MLMRLSQASNLSEHSDGLTPSIALKWLVDGWWSQNLLAMEKFTSSGQWNFLGPRLTTRLPAFDTSTETGYILDQTLRKKLTDRTHRPFALAVEHLARWTLEDGKMHKRDKVAPYQIHLVSPIADRISAEKEFDQNNEQVSWYNQLKREVKAGDVIYEVYAQTGPVYDGEVLEDKLLKIGEISMTTDFVTSEWADTQLRFLHR